MAPFEGDDVPLSNPSFFAKKIREGNALGLLTGSYPRILIFGGPPSYARSTEARRDLKYGDTRSLEGALGAKKSLADGRPIHMPISSVIDPASGHRAVGVMSTLKS
jgi:hypothetical protein